MQEVKWFYFLSQPMTTFDSPRDRNKIKPQPLPHPGPKTLAFQKVEQRIIKPGRCVIAHTQQLTVAPSDELQKLLGHCLTDSVRENL